jgi:hypothetical protein
MNIGESSGLTRLNYTGFMSWAEPHLAGARQHVLLTYWPLLYTSNPSDLDFSIELTADRVYLLFSDTKVFSVHPRSIP